MKAKEWISVLVLAGALATNCLGQEPVITSFHGSGTVSWTNTLNSNALYRVEWAPRAGGPWHSFTYQPINTIDAGDRTSFQMEVPMFYRVVMTTGQPPAGMVWIDGGDVELGQNGIATPVHTNFISGFWMDEAEISFSKWKDVYAWAITNGYTFDNLGSGRTNNHPVQSVDWYDCVKWCNARSQQEGLTPCYYVDASFACLYQTGLVEVINGWVDWTANGYRLPTEAEWEKAARGGRQGRTFPWGKDTIQHALANYLADTNSFSYDTSPTQGNHPEYQDGPVPHTSPTGCFPANGYGLHDMAGNVFEWCWDRYGDYTENYTNDAHGPVTGALRVLRGGSCDDHASFARVADRWSNYPDVEYSLFGFRCVRSH